VRSLHDARQRRRHRLFVAEGVNSVAAALAVRWRLRQLLAAPEDLADGWQELADQAGVVTRAVHPDILEYLSEAKTSPGVLALAELPANVEWPAEGLMLVLDSVSDPGNVGTLIRSADAAGVAGVVVTDEAADPFGPKAVRASSGSIFHLPPLHLDSCSPDAVVTELQRREVPIVVATPREGHNCFEWRWPRHAALILGHETRGVADAFMEQATAHVSIPMHGKAESLNVASAGATLFRGARHRAERRRGKA